MNATNKILILVDTSYWLYYTIFGAISLFMKNEKELASIWLKPADEVDQHNLPDLTNCLEFMKILRKHVMSKLESINWLTDVSCHDILDMVDKRDIIFCIDDAVRNNFRKQLYPEYKAQRVLAKKQYNVSALKDYILNVIFKELEVESKYGYKILKVKDAEGDDVIAALANKYKDSYMQTVIIASDKDFLQIDGVRQINMFGQIPVRKVADEEVDAKTYLNVKILTGDGADNIHQVFERVGQKRALKLVRDKAKLKEMLLENQTAAKQYILNKKLISFDCIPEELTNEIVKNAECLLENTSNNSSIDLADFMDL